MNFRTAIAGVTSITALLVSASLISGAETDTEGAIGLFVGVVGLGMSLVFAVAWQDYLTGREIKRQRREIERQHRRRPF